MLRQNRIKLPSGEGQAPQRRAAAGLAVGFTALAFGTLLCAWPPAQALAAPSEDRRPAMAECRAEPPSEMTARAQIEPRLIVDEHCVDPYFNAGNFVIASTTQQTNTGIGGPIPYTEIKGYFRARDRNADPLPAGVADSPSLRRQDYVFRIPDRRFFRNRVMQIQHPVTENSIVENRLAFTNGAMSVNHVNARPGNSSGHWRHSAAATKIAEAMVRKMYGTTGRIYGYYWGCSGGGQMAQAAAEGQTDVWEGIIVVCPATRGNPAHA